MIAATSAVALGIAAVTTIVAYAAIVRSTGRSVRELAWTLVPAALLVALFVWTALSTGALVG